MYLPLSGNLVSSPGEHGRVSPLLARRIRYAMKDRYPPAAFMFIFSSPINAGSVSVFSAVQCSAAMTAQKTCASVMACSVLLLLVHACVVVGTLEGPNVCTRQDT
uniref:Uncharacterized protein n=1 Tax=Timema tahoe TaxID=61484 RepID=A0A7R9IQP4_9NEOP|nr:unnamed protein product [Timema tahoe]